MQSFNIFQRLRLRHLLFATLTLVSVIPVLLLEVWVERTAEKNEFDAIADKHVLLAHNLTESLNRYVTDVSGVFSFAANSLTNGSSDQSLLALLNKLHFRHLCTVDNTGRVLKKLMVSDGLDKTMIAAQIKRMLDNGISPGKVSFSPVSTGSLGRPAIFISVRLSDEHFAIGELSTDYMIQLQRAIAFGEMGHAAIVDASGQLLAHPRSDWVDEMKNLSAVDPVRRMMAGETGVSFFYSPATKLDMVAGFSTVPDVGWGVMIPQPIYELEERAKEITIMGTRILVAGIIIAALLSWWIAGYLSGPITVLTQAARRFKPGTGGDTHIKHRGFVPRELRTLTDSFNSMIEDISATNAALEQKSAVLKITLDNMVEGITLVDRNGRLLVANRSFQEFFEVDAARLEEAPKISDLQLDMYAEDDESSLLQPQDTKPVELVHANGRVIELRNNQLSDGQLVTSYTDITERNKADAHVRYLAWHDPLTGLPNRFAFCDQLEKLVGEPSQPHASAAMLYIDLDEFKDINDTLGHNAGDLLLQEVSKRLQSCLSSDDSVGRLGGDEFGIIQRNLSSREDASALAQRVIDIVSEPYQISENELFIGATVGIVIVPDDSNDPEQIYSKADLAMYAAKAENRNSFKFFSAHMEEIAHARKFLEDDLRKALNSKMASAQLSVVYQPIMDLDTLNIKGFEALARWHHPQRGAVEPTEFIPLAERSGLIIPLGEWVMEHACQTLKKLHDLGHTRLQISVNLSAVQLRKSSFPDVVTRILSDTGVEAQYLDLEITETTAMHDLDVVLGILEMLNTLGVSISIDDFGTGYSSLSQLKSLPVDRIKMDASFIQALNMDETPASIVDAILGLGRSMDLPVVAEGVETVEQFRFVRQRGCSEIQGYYLSKPMLAGDMEHWLKEFPYRRMKLVEETIDIKHRNEYPDLEKIVLN